MTVLVESDFTIHERKKRPIATRAYVLSRDEFSSTLPHQNAARADQFAAVSFYSQPLADTVPAVANTTLTFLMSHNF